MDEATIDLMHVTKRVNEKYFVICEYSSNVLIVTVYDPVMP